MAHTVGEVARLARVSVRALHHYDAIGLLTPSGRTQAGYRLYTDDDLARLQQILFFRELGFALEDVQKMVTAPDFDRRAALVAQRRLLVERGEHVQTMITLVDRTLASLEKGTVMNGEEMFEGFDPSVHAEEAKERWGDTPAYAESARRTKRYSKDDWAKIRAEADAIEAALAAALTSGVAPTDGAARALAEKHRLHIEQWFYPCPPAMHAGLGQMYVSDPRFAEHYEKRAAGLAQYVCDAIRANAKS